MASDDSLERTLASAVDELATVGDFIRFGASRFNEHGLCFGHGTADAVDDATKLVLHALALDPQPPAELFQARLTRDEKQRVAGLLRRRISERRPAAYLTNTAWFAHLRFYVDERVLIPRSPIAECIEAGFEPWIEAGRVERILDLGTGSGCIAIACALAFPRARVDAVDISARALEVARRNVSDHGLDGRVHLVESDLYDALDARYDLIVSDPPYVTEVEFARLPAEYAYEPRAAFLAGADGLAYVRRILAGAVDHLTEHGILVLEVGSSRDVLHAAYPEAAFIWLEFERGGDNVLEIDRRALQAGLSKKEKGSTRKKRPKS